MKSFLMSLLISTSFATGVQADTDTGNIKFTVAMLADVPVLGDTCSIPAEKQAAAGAMLDGIIEAHPDLAYIVDEVQAERLAKPLTQKQKTTYCPVLLRFLEEVLP
jgi:hypothetical protein